MKLIAAVDSKWGIGRNGRLLFSIPEDMKFFREQTTGKGRCYGLQYPALTSRLKAA